MDGITCTSDTCPCRTGADLGPAIGSLVNDQQHTDYIVFPLVAGVLAHCVLAEERPDAARMPHDLRETGLADHARIILRLAGASPPNDDWGRERDAFSTIVDFVLAGWDVFLRWVPEHYVFASGWDGTSTAGLLKCAREWVRQSQQRTLTELVLFTADVANRIVSTKPEFPLHSKALRPLRVELAARLRAAGLVTWPSVLQASASDWEVRTLERLLLDYAADPLTISRAILESNAGDVGWSRDPDWDFADLDDEPDESDEPDDEPDSPADDRRSLEQPVPRDPDAEALLAEALAEIDRSEARGRAIEAERLKLADRCAGLQGHVERLTSELSESRAAAKRLDSELASLRRERDELADCLVGEETLAGDRPAPPADVFAGRRIYVFTGSPTGDVREELGARFRAFGATDVVVYDMDVNRGPDAYVPNAIVVLDVSHMGHSASEYVLGKARSSHVWYFRGAYGAARLASAAAAAYAARLGHVRAGP